MTMKDIANQNSILFGTGTSEVNPDVAQDYRPIAIRTTLRDRLGGTTSVERIWGPTPNLHVLSLKASDAAVRGRVREFFLARELRPLFHSLSKTARFKIGEKMFTTDEVVAAIKKRVDNDDAAIVISELVMPVLHKIGMIADARVFTLNIVYGFKRITPAVLSDAVIMEEVLRVTTRVMEHLPFNAGDMYSTDTFAVQLADSFVSVGAKLIEMNELGDIVTDLVRGVRSYIDPELTGLTGTIAPSWTNCETVVELSTCFPFVLEALMLPKGSSIAPRHEYSKLMSWAPKVLAALKTSPRYAFVSGPAYAQDIGKKTLVDLKGIPRYSFLWRNAAVNPTGQAVIVTDDSYLPSGSDIRESRSPIASTIASAYANAETLSTKTAVAYMARSLQHLIDNGYLPPLTCEVVDIGLDSASEIDLLEFVTLHAHRIEFDRNYLLDPVAAVRANEGQAEPDASDEDGQDAALSSGSFEKVRALVRHLFIVVETPYVHTPGNLLGNVINGMYQTTDLHDAALMMHDLEPVSSMPARPQLISKSAYGTTVIGLRTDNLLIPVVDKMPYNVNIGQIHAHGRIKFNAISSFACPDYVRIVKPLFNEAVFDVLEYALESMKKHEKLIEKDENRAVNTPLNARTLDYALQIRVQYVRELASAISPVLKRAVSDAVERDVTRGLASERATLMSGQMVQQHFRAVMDLVTLAYFLAVQGCSYKFITDTFKEDDFQSYLMLCGSDK